MIVWSGGDAPCAPGRPAPREEQPPRAGARRRSVLVVDDDDSILDTVSEILRAEGYHVVTASNGREALAQVERAEPALVLLDMRMPVLDGWGVAKALSDRRVSLPIVVMTAADDARRWADEISATAYIAKPFEIDALLDLVERYAAPRH